MAYEFISDTTKTLMEQHRVKEAMDFCERVISEHPFPERKAIAYRDLSEICFFLAGDGVTARKANEAGLKILDADLDGLVFHSKRAPSSIMKRVYSDLCEQIRTIAISYDEYEAYAEKTAKAGIRKKNSQEVRGLAVCEKNRSNNVPWYEDLFMKVSDYAAHQAAGQMASTLSVVIRYGREMRVKRDDLNSHVLPGYAQAILGLVAEHANACVSAGHRVDTQNCLYLIENAKELLRTCGEENARNVDSSVLEKVLAMLEKERSRIERQFETQQGNIPHPTKDEIDAGFIKSVEGAPQIALREDDTPHPDPREDETPYSFLQGDETSHFYPQEDEMPRKKQKQHIIFERPSQPVGCSVGFIILSFIVTALAWWWAVGRGDVKWYGIIIAVILSLFTFGALPMHIKNIRAGKK
jgi:hypothetical protein